MSPFLKVGDCLHVRKVPWERLRIGDLVVFETMGSRYPIVHRLVGWQRQSNNRFGCLKGDNLAHADPFLLLQGNYLGRVRTIRTSRKLVSMDSLCQRIRARWIALLSVWNLTPGILRHRIKKDLDRMVPRIPGLKNIKRTLLKKTICFIFSGQGNTRRMCLIFRDMAVGEIVFRNNPSSVIGSAVSSIFSSFISAADLTESAMERYPDVFDS